MTVLFKEPSPAPLQEAEDAVSNGAFGSLNVSKLDLLSSGEFIHLKWWSLVYTGNQFENLIFIQFLQMSYSLFRFF